MKNKTALWRKIRYRPSDGINSNWKKGVRFICMHGLCMALHGMRNTLVIHTILVHGWTARMGFGRAADTPNGIRASPI